MTGYFPKFGGFVAAVSYRKGAAWDVDGLSATSVKFLMASRGAWLVFGLRKVADWKSIDPGSSATKGKWGGY